MALPPDVAVEIVSSEQRVSALVRTCLWYVEHGVQAALLAAPADRWVLVPRPGGRLPAPPGADQVEPPDVAPGFALSLQELVAALQA